MGDVVKVLKDGKEEEVLSTIVADHKDAYNKLAAKYFIHGWCTPSCTGFLFANGTWTRKKMRNGSNLIKAFLVY